MRLQMWWRTIAVMVVSLLVPAALSQAKAIPTKVIVRAVASDAKAIWDGVGGARITIREVASGRVLAEGIQKGKSGSTELIMLKPRVRDATVFGTPDTAAFQATLMLEHPTVVEVTAEGPLGASHALQRASKTLLLVPGQHVLGEGILLEINGFIVKLLSPSPESRPEAGQPLTVRATVTMT